MKIEAAQFLPFLRENLDSLKASCVPLWHPLGFVSCVIKEQKGGHLVRVHYWPIGIRRVKNPDWPIHTHTYRLSSLILFGCIRDQQYKVSEGCGYTIYEVGYYDGGSEIVKTSRAVDIVPVIDVERRSGDQYSVERGVFHQTKVREDECAVTMVALTDFGDERPQVLGSSEQDKYPYDRIEFDPKLFWGAVERGIK